MRSHGLLFLFIGLFTVILFWSEYFINITRILYLDKIYLLILLLTGMIVTIVGGIMIGIGLKILFNPEFYDRLKSLLKE